MMKHKLTYLFTCLTIIFYPISGQDAVQPEDVLNLQYIRTEQLGPDGEKLIYGVYTQRGPNEKPGPARLQYYIMNLENGEKEQLLDDTLNLRSPRFSPDGSSIAFLYKKGKGNTQVWLMPSVGGDMIQLTRSEGNISSFRWHPQGKGIIYLASEPKSPKETELEKRGYKFIFYEENLKNSHLYHVQFDEEFNQASLKQLTDGIHVWDFNFNKQGDQIAFTASEKNLIDQRYMFRKIYVLDLESGSYKVVVKDRGKLGNYAFSPNGEKLAFTSALNINDHAVSQALVMDLEDKQMKNLTPEGFKGHMSWVQWKDNQHVVVYADEGVYPNLSVMPIDGTDREILLDAAETGIIFSPPLFTDEFKKIVVNGSAPYDPYNIYSWDSNGKMEKLTDINDHFEGKIFGKQKVFHFPARDGQTIEGIVIEPVDYQPDRKYPLIVYVHGGPESHHSNGWLSHYSTPGQVMAGKGYLVAFINYRASTGYGVDFAMEGFGDPAGKEFDDIADGIDYLVKEKGADPDRVGVAGGSYGGYASAWFATYYTEYAKAVCMFVGVSNLISKKGTTDIPYEDLLVHMGKPLKEMWQLSLERSPIYWAHQSETATLIYGGAADTRVHPSQSLELYRRMKMNGHPSVRLVQYPGEGHGNRKQVNRMDVLYRQIGWFDWYVKDNKPIDGPMPPLDISDKYGLDWEF